MSNEWTEWDGSGEDCPVAKGVLVDVRYSDGDEAYAIPALTGGDFKSRDGYNCGAEYWGSITEWRLHDASRPLPSDPPTLETMLTEWRDLEARAKAAQAEADALFEHAGQCHGEIVVRLAELGWGAPRGPMVQGEPVVTLDEIEPWVIGGHAAPDDATHYGAETSQFNEGFYKLTGDDWMFRTMTGEHWLTLGKNAGDDDTSRFISRPSTQP